MTVREIPTSCCGSDTASSNFNGLMPRRCRIFESRSGQKRYLLLQSWIHIRLPPGIGSSYSRLQLDASSQLSLNSSRPSLLPI